MDRLPENLLYMVSQISNYSKNTVKIQTLNQTTLAPSGGASQLRLSLPVNALVNMKSLALHGTFSTKGVDESAANAKDKVFALIPKNGFASVIDRLTFSAGGIALDSGFSGYNVVSTMKENIEKSAAKYMSDDKVLNQSILESIDETGTYEAANFGQQKQLILANFLGFSGCEPTFLDLNRLPEVFLTIQVTSASVLPVQYEGAVLGGAAVNANPNFSGNGCSYTIDNIFFTIEVISIGNGLYDALTSRLLEEKGSLDVPYKNFNTFTTDQSSAGGSIRGSVSTMSLDKVFAFQRNSAKKTDGSPYEQYYIQQAPVPAVGNTTFGFTNAGLNFISSGLQDWFFQINNAPYPLYKPDTVDAYAYAVASCDRQYSKYRGSLVGSQATWKDNCWVAVQKLNHDDDPRLISGLNLASINSQISFTSTSNNTQAENWERQVWLVTESTSMLRIGASRSIAVVA